jgi:hypothetical protein
MKKQRNMCWTRRKFDPRFGAQSLRPVIRKMINPKLI